MNNEATKSTEVGTQSYFALDDSQLVELTLAGDDGAFGSLYERYLPRVNMVCGRLVQDRETVKDLSHDAFLKARLSLSSYNKSISAFSTWLCSIAWNECLSHLRTLNRRRELLEAYQFEKTGQILNAHTRPERNENVERLYECLDKLKEEHRFCYEGFHFHGFRYRDIAVQAHLSDGQVRRFMETAKRNLRDCLDR